MTAPNSISGYQLQIFLGDGASPEVFAIPCMINTARGIEFTADFEETDIPDCGAGADATFWKKRTKTSKTGSINGSGIIDVDSLPTFVTWWGSKNSKNIKVKAADGTLNGEWAGAAHLATFQLGAEGPHGEVTFSCSIVSTGAWTFTP